MLPTGCICFWVSFFFVPSNGKYLKIFSRPKHEILLISLLAILLDNKIWKYSFHYSNKHKFPFLIYIKWKCKIFAICLLRSQAPSPKKSRELKRKLTPYLLTPKCNIVGWRCYRSFLYTIIHIFFLLLFNKMSTNNNDFLLFGKPTIPTTTKFVFKFV